MSSHQSHQIIQDTGPDLLADVLRASRTKEHAEKALDIVMDIHSWKQDTVKACGLLRDLISSIDLETIDRKVKEISHSSLYPASFISGSPTSSNDKVDRDSTPNTSFSSNLTSKSTTQDLVEFGVDEKQITCQENPKSIKSSADDVPELVGCEVPSSSSADHLSCPSTPIRVPVLKPTTPTTVEQAHYQCRQRSLPAPIKDLLSFTPQSTSSPSANFKAKIIAPVQLEDPFVDAEGLAQTSQPVLRFALPPKSRLSVPSYGAPCVEPYESLQQGVPLSASITPVHKSRIPPTAPRAIRDEWLHNVLFQSNDPTPFHRVVITGLLAGVTPSQVLGKVRGGAIFSIELLNTLHIIGSMSALVRFITGAGAALYVNFAKNNAIKLDGAELAVDMVPSHTNTRVPYDVAQYLNAGGSRCLEVHGLAADDDLNALKRDCTRFMYSCGLSVVDSIAFNSRGILEIAFLSVRYALAAKWELESVYRGNRYGDCHVCFGNDPCMAPVDELKQEDPRRGVLRWQWSSAKTREEQQQQEKNEEDDYADRREAGKQCGGRVPSRTRLRIIGANASAEGDAKKEQAAVSSFDSDGGRRMFPRIARPRGGVHAKSECGACELPTLEGRTSPKDTANAEAPRVPNITTKEMLKSTWAPGAARERAEAGELAKSAAADCTADGKPPCMPNIVRADPRLRLRHRKPMENGRAYEAWGSKEGGGYVFYQR